MQLDRLKRFIILLFLNILLLVSTNIFINFGNGNKRKFRSNSYLQNLIKIHLFLQICGLYLIKAAVFNSKGVDYSVFQIDPQNFKKFCLTLIVLGAVISVISILGPVSYLLDITSILQAVKILHTHKYMK